MRLYVLLPGFVRQFMWRLLLRNPFRVKRMMGTAALTSVGMMGAADGWIVPTTIHPVCFALGSITRKRIAGKAGLAIREYLKMMYFYEYINDNSCNKAERIRKGVFALTKKINLV